MSAVATPELPGLWDRGPWRSLPRLWDGREVEWSGFALWPKPAHHRWLFEDVCPRCGCVDDQSSARGVVWCRPGDLVDASGQVLPSGRQHWRDHEVRAGERVVFQNLHASRCPRCGQDTVLDLLTAQMWSLDESDYGPEGSWQR